MLIKPDWPLGYTPSYEEWDAFLTALTDATNLAFQQRGLYDEEIEYNENDVVYYSGAFYVAIQTSAGANPATSPSDWLVLGGGGGAGVGDVVGPASAVVGRIATFAAVDGKSIQDGGKSLPSGAIVGTTDAQTLTNKTLTSPTISGGSISGIADLPVADGGTGASSASVARTNLGAAASGAVASSGLTMATAKILGRATAASGAIEEINVTDNLSLSGSELKVVNLPFQKIAETTLAVDTGTITFSAIPATFKHLEIQGFVRGNISSNFTTLKYRFNSDAANNYRWRFGYFEGSAGVDFGTGVDFAFNGYLNGNTLPSGEFSEFSVRVNNYANTTIRKFSRASSAHTVNTSPMFSYTTNFWNSTAAINSITIFPHAGLFLAGSVLTLYGIL